jgi:phospholipase/carboxylesterase
MTPAAKPAGPHAAMPVLQAGPALHEAVGAVVLVHGRGASAEDILGLVRPLGDERLAYFAPQAAGSVWYPHSFLAERAENEPYLTSALEKMATIVDGIVAAGIARERIVIAGFSQGACLSCEFVATHPARYAGVMAFTGGLVGPLGSDVSHAGDLAGTPVLLLSGDPDPHVPWSRVQETGEVLAGMGAQVTLQRYPGRPHTVSGEEIVLARRLLAQAFPRP